MQAIHTARNAHNHVGLVFFDLAKAFDTVWHRGLLAKLRTVYRIDGKAIGWLSSYLSNRHQLVRLSTVLSEPLPVTSGVPQGSILGPLLFLLYINDLPDIAPGVSLFADDTALLCSNACPIRLHEAMQDSIGKVITWMHDWKLQPNVDKTAAMYISPSPPSLPLCFPSSSVAIRIVEEHKHLGVIIDSKLSWSAHVQYVCKRTSSILGALQAHCRHLPLSCKRSFYHCYILPLLDYCDTAWSGITTTVLNKLETHNRMLLKILFSKDRRFPSASLYEIAKICPLSTRHKYHLCVLIHKILLNKIPLHMQAYNWFSETRNTRNSLSLPRAASTLEAYNEAVHFRLNAFNPPRGLVGKAFVEQLRLYLSHYADDTTLYTSQQTPKVAAQSLQVSVDRLHEWGRTWKVIFEPTKSQAIFIILYFHDGPWPIRKII